MAIDGEKVEIVTDFIFLDSKSLWMVTAATKLKDAFSLEGKLRQRAKTNLNRLLKSRDIILATKVHIVKAMIFSVVMYSCESWCKSNCGFAFAEIWAGIRF